MQDSELFSHYANGVERERASECVYLLPPLKCILSAEHAAFFHFMLRG